MSEIEAIFKQLGFTVNGGAIILTIFAMNYMGLLLKKSSKFKDEFIPIMLGVVASVMYSAMTDCSPTNASIGFVCGLTSVGGNQLFRQLMSFFRLPPSDQSQDKALPPDEKPQV